MLLIHRYNTPILTGPSLVILAKKIYSGNFDILTISKPNEKHINPLNAELNSI
jgi:hypothetical protein